MSQNEAKIDRENHELKKLCFQCGKNGADMFGYAICDSCKSKLGLFTDATIKKYDSMKFREEISNRLKILEKDFIKKKIKLLHIQERLKQINNVG